jgi:hypothetical protein
MDYLVDSFGIFKLALKRGADGTFIFRSYFSFSEEFTVFPLLDGHVAVM